MRGGSLGYTKPVALAENECSLLWKAGCVVGEELEEG